MRTGLVVCIIFIFAACADHTKIPKNIIQKDKMQKVLWDMIQADRFATNFLPKRGDSTFNTTEVLKVYQKVFDVHGITRDEFLKSYTFYLNHPDITKVLYDSISAQAERRRDEVYKSKTNADSLKMNLKKDSLRKHSSFLDTTRKQRLDSIRNRLQKK